jgi:hypothetical protein
MSLLDGEIRTGARAIKAETSDAIAEEELAPSAKYACTGRRGTPETFPLGVFTLKKPVNVINSAVLKADFVDFSAFKA